MKKDLINQIIQDTTNKENISDGVFTLGELHSDRLSLAVTLFTFLDKIIKEKKLDEYLWISKEDYNGTITKGHFHVGIKSKPGIEDIGMLVPNILKEYIDTLNPTTLMQSPNYPKLHKSLIQFI
jgi:hypothetical protein